MELKDEKTINAPRDKVYAALNDPEVLRQCIPGCQSLEKVDDTHLEATAALKVGPVSAKFKGNVELTNLNPPESYTIVGEGKGGAAGFAKGKADVRLIEVDADTTTMSYDVQADVGGKMAQLGGRLIDSTAKKLSGQFFDKFKEIVEGDGAAAAPAPAEAASAEPAVARPEPAEPATAAAAGGAMSPTGSQPASATGAAAPPRQAAPPPAEEGGTPYARYAVIAACAAAVVIIVALLLD